MVLLYNDGGEGALKNAEIAMAASELLRGAGILITPEEQQRMEVADFGLGDLAKTGLQILTGLRPIPILQLLNSCNS